MEHGFGTDGFTLLLNYGLCRRLSVGVGFLLRLFKGLVVVLFC